MDIGNKEMWTEEHWVLFDILEKCFRERFSKDSDHFGANFKEFKAHMLYILEVMERSYGDKCHKDER